MLYLVPLSASRQLVTLVRPVGSSKRSRSLFLGPRVQAWRIRVGGSQGARAELAKGPTTHTLSAHAVNRPYIISGILFHSLRRPLNPIIPVDTGSSFSLLFGKTGVDAFRDSDPHRPNRRRPDQRAEQQSIAIPWHQVWKRHTSRPSSPTAQHR